MSAVATGSARWRFASARPSPELFRIVGPTAFGLANAIAFYLLRPDVPDLWAARARASAAAHGVGLTYWFSWFGGSTPGSYSVMTPYLCAALGSELVAGLAATVICACATILVRHTPRPGWASAVAAGSVAVNLWCGRVPFLLGAAFGVGALVCVKARRVVPTAALTIASVLASPVAGVFITLGLSGVVVARRTRAHRTSAVLCVGSAGGTLIAIAALFGAPGPEPFPPYLLGAVVLALALMLLSAPPDHLRITLTLCLSAGLLLAAVPNGMGANFLRLALFCLPTAAIALSRRGRWTLAALSAPIFLLGLLTSASAVVSATRPGSSAAYYAPLAAELDTLPTATNHRLELVNAAHAGYAALLNHALLARGWETQEDHAFNSALESTTLDARSYRAWLDANAVGFVAVNRSGVATPESRVVGGGGRSYLHQIWASANWRLYAVVHATPIVAEPASLETATMAAMIVQVPCACRIPVRIRWSKFLVVHARLPAHTPDSVEDTDHVRLTEDGSGGTALTTSRPGTYVLDGSL